MYKHNSNGQIPNDIRLLASEPTTTVQQAMQKRKTDQVVDSDVLG